MRRFINLTLFFIGSILISQASYAVVDIDADVIKVRKSCIEAGVAMDNCFETMGNAITWMTSVRTPVLSSSSQLLVEIGPGDFREFIACGGAMHHVSFRGAGMYKTVIGRMTLAAGCTELSFSDLTVQNDGNDFGIGYAIIMLNPGNNTRWNNVFMNGFWDEYVAGGQGCNIQGRHTWSNSITRGEYKVGCDKTWFFASEITGLASVGTTYDMNIFTITTGEVHVYGSNISAIYDDTALIPGLIANNHRVASVSNGGELHIHGTGIDVMSNTVSNIVALETGTGGKIHANASAYNMSTGTGGTITRLINTGGTIKAPYQWEEGTTPPDIISITGADTVIDTSGAAPRSLVYNSSCVGPNGPWSVIATGVCI